jgi:MinD-like ATPase involved in chromosome partitioning or flagellar assembly
VSDTRRGQIITFYSYKGGTGRSMALANIGCLLARSEEQSKKKRVLLVDWDLEAPGLHRFFRGHFSEASGHATAPIPQDLDSHPGLINLLTRLKNALQKLPPRTEEPHPQADSFLRNVARLDEYILETDLEGLHFLKAGRLDDQYPSRVNRFPWASIHGRSPWFFQWLGNVLAEHYDYVLIDSRTGITDASGICTTLLPEKLVVVFTPNYQSLDGALELTKKAIEFRGRSDDLRPLTIFPLPSRIEPTLERLRHHWRFDSTIGYQSRFEQAFGSAYKLEKCDLSSYFDEVQVQQVPDYAYGEEIAVLLQQDSGDRFSLARSFQAFASRLTSNAAPWQPSTPPFYSVFISYSPKDKEFVHRLHGDLAKKGVRTWLDAQDLNAGDVWQERIREAIKESDKILLILSDHSVESEWVRREVDQAFEKERESNKLVLVPITLDNTVMSSNAPWASDIRKVRHIGDFRNWKDSAEYQSAIDRLLRDLRTP